LLALRRVLTPGGTMVIVGGSKGNWITPMDRPIKGFMLSPFMSEEFVMLLADLNQQDLTLLAGLMQAGKVTPVIDRRYPLSEAAAAVGYLEEGHARGKVVIVPDEARGPTALMGAEPT